MDPFEFFSRFLGIPEMISNHLNGNDLIKWSEVGPSYYNFIASSKALMAKIQIVFDESRVLENSKDSDLLQNSARLYQYIRFHREASTYITEPELDFFHKNVRQWKNVSLKNIRFRKKRDLWEFISSIESSVENLSVIEYDIHGYLQICDSDSVPLETFKFPKLKKLKLWLCESSCEAFARFLLSSIAIEKFEYRNSAEEGGTVLLKRMLQNFDKLTSFTLHVNLSKSYRTFEDKSWRFNFKLKSFTMINHPRFRIGNNFQNFLKAQSKNLEKLNIKAVRERKILDVIINMPKLKFLGLHYFDDSYNETPIKISKSITELQVRYSITGDNLKLLLQSMPNVKRLTICFVDRENLRALKSMNRKFDYMKIHQKLNDETIDISVEEKYFTSEHRPVPDTEVPYTCFGPHSLYKAQNLFNRNFFKTFLGPNSI